MALRTTFMLMAQYNGRAVIPVETVCSDYFAPLTVDKFMRKIMAGEIALPIVRMGESQKAARGIPLEDLAEYLDRRIDAARKERDQLARGAA